MNNSSTTLFLHVVHCKGLCKTVSAHFIIKIMIKNTVSNASKYFYATNPGISYFHVIIVICNRNMMLYHGP